MKTFLLKASLIGLGVGAMYVEGQVNGSAPGVGFGVAMILFVASVFVNLDGRYQ